jgi:hypothetical protein
VYRIDPVLRRDFQQLRLRGTADPDLLDLGWWVDGERLDAPLESAAWTLAPGRHRIELRGVSPDGHRLRSRPAEVTIRG